jgi:RNA polymerase sigma-70 factor (ECF subfamily)
LALADDHPAAFSAAPEDRDLMARLAGGDGDALAPLMERHHRRLYRIALGYVRDADEALDVVQETFVKAYVNARKYDAAAEVGAWLARIAVNHSIDVYRRGRRRRQAEEPLEEGDRSAELASPAPSPDRGVFARELRDRVGAAVASLPEKQRAVFVLRHYDGRTLEEIADTLGLRLGTVKSALHRAVHHVRQRLSAVRA